MFPFVLHMQSRVIKMLIPFYHSRFSHSEKGRRTFFMLRNFTDEKTRFLARRMSVKRCASGWFIELSFLRSHARMWAKEVWGREE